MPFQDCGMIVEWGVTGLGIASARPVLGELVLVLQGMQEACQEYLYARSVPGRGWAYF